MFIWIAFFFALLAGVLAGLYAGLLHCKTGEKGRRSPHKQMRRRKRSGDGQRN